MTDQHGGLKQKRRQQPNETTLWYRVFIKFCVFPLIFFNFWTLPVLLQRWCFTCLSVYTHWHQGKTEKNRVRNIHKSLEKTQYLMNTLYVLFFCFLCYSISLTARHISYPYDFIDIDVMMRILSVPILEYFSQLLLQPSHQAIQLILNQTIVSLKWERKRITCASISSNINNKLKGNFLKLSFHYPPNKGCSMVENFHFLHFPWIRWILCTCVHNLICICIWIRHIDPTTRLLSVLRTKMHF